MDSANLSILRVGVFIALSLFFVVVSRRPLRNPRCHGFYRFFAFEGIALLFALNFPFWFDDRYAPRQLLSWLLLFASLILAIHGFFLLRRRGGSAGRQTAPENFAFENTARLVTSGIYRYIRHPLYSSLLLLAWGIFLKGITPATAATVALTTLFLMAAARMEERENLAYFGPVYRGYMHRTRRFIPFLF